MTPHFTLSELTASDYAARHGLDNIPDAETVVNLARLAGVMEQVRGILKHPIIVHSGYRSPRVNAGVGGSPHSAHLLGLGCDFTCPAFGSPYLVALAIEAAGIGYDQLIREYGWVHLAIPRDGSARRIALTKKSAGAPYERGILV